MAEEQNLNSLDRFRKNPGRLVLEQHSHCEVPAGCGGVVLRWRNPLAAFPLTIRYYTPGKLHFFIDGVELTTGRPDVVPGPHVLGLRLDEVDLSAGLLLMALYHEPRQAQQAPSAMVEPSFQVVTADDNSWLFSLDPGIEDSAWQPLVRAATPTLNDRDSGYYQCRQCTEMGAICLALPDRPTKKVMGTVHIRKHFHVPVPEERPS